MPRSGFFLREKLRVKKLQTFIAAGIIVTGIGGLIVVGSTIVKHEKYAETTEKLIEQDSLA